MIKKTFHIIGVCGIGMSAIAQILKSNHNYDVQGSDIDGARSKYIKKLLDKADIKVFFDHKAHNIKNADIIIKSAAILDDNPEIQEAKILNKPILRRCDILRTILKTKTVIAVSGCHGKSTTTAMIGQILVDANFDPTIICGAIMNKFQNNIRIGKSDLFVIEADESDNTLNKIPKNVAVLTNIGIDHLEFYQDQAQVMKTFTDFICGAKAIVPSQMSKHIKYDKSIEFYDFCYKANKSKIFDIKNHSWQSEFKYKVGSSIKNFSLNLLGRHNVQNAAASIACADLFGIKSEVVQNSLKSFIGIKRRLTKIGKFLDNEVIDDYAHHPEEIESTLIALNQISKDIIAIIQPHRYTRVKNFLNDYVKSFSFAKHILLLDVFAAGERNNGFDSKSIYQKAKKSNISNIYYITKKDVKKKIIEINQKNGLIVFMGAGDITNLAHSITS